MKPYVRQIKKTMNLQNNYMQPVTMIAMYFAGIIADSKAMSEADYNRWIEQAYFYMISDYVVAVTLAESDIAQQISDKWIASVDELKMSAGWHCYCWLLGNKKDEEFSVEKLRGMLKQVKQNINLVPPRTQVAMNNFVMTVGVSFKPLHNEALQIANDIGEVEIKREGKKPGILNAYAEIVKQVEKGRIGFKRKYIRC